MANLDCRIVAMFSVAISLLLLGSVILLRHYHHRTDSHLSSEALVMDPGCTSGNCDKPELDVKSTTTTVRPPQNKSLYIHEECLQCICEVETSCRPRTCGGDPCGPFRIHKSYWIDAGKPTKDADAAGDSHGEYVDCVTNAQCARRTVSAYVRMYSRDCNEDGVIDCADYMLIHHFGPTGCLRNEDLRMEFLLDQCLLGSPK